MNTLPEAVFDLASKIKSSIMFVGRLLSVGMWLPLLFKVVSQDPDFGLAPVTTVIAALITVIMFYATSWFGVGILVGLFVLRSG